MGLFTATYAFSLLSERVRLILDTKTRIRIGVGVFRVVVRISIMVGISVTNNLVHIM